MMHTATRALLLLFGHTYSDTWFWWPSHSCLCQIRAHFLPYPTCRTLITMILLTSTLFACNYAAHHGQKSSSNPFPWCVPIPSIVVVCTQAWPWLYMYDLPICANSDRGIQLCCELTHRSVIISSPLLYSSTLPGASCASYIYGHGSSPCQV